MSLQVLYPVVDKAIKQPLTAENFQILLTPPVTPPGTLFALPQTQEYILKRFINACMSSEAEIRDRVQEVLAKWVKESGVKPDGDKLGKFVLDVSAYKRGGGKKSEIEGFATGRVLVVKVLAQFLKGNTQLFESVAQVAKDYEHLEEEVIEACHLISHDKLLKLKFMSLQPKTRPARLLHRLLLPSKDPQAQPPTLAQLHQLLKQTLSHFPQPSTALLYFGKHLSVLTPSPASFFLPFANKYLDDESQSEAPLPQIFYILTILQGHLSTTTISSSNYNTHFQKRIISVWLQQFRVLNKKMKALAKKISIEFDQGDSGLAQRVLKDLHEEGVYLDNVSERHPLVGLYKAVEAGSYWQYVYGLCVNGEIKGVQNKELKQGNKSKETKIDDQNKADKKAKKNSKKSAQPEPTLQPTPEPQSQPEQAPLTFFNQLQFFIKLRLEQLPDSHLCDTLTLLLNRYHSHEQQKQLLYLCINLMNLICTTLNKKKNHSNPNEYNRKRFNKRMLVLLGVVDLGKITKLTQEQASTFKECVAWVKKSTLRLRKQTEEVVEEAEVDFYNFYECMLFFCLIYPDQLETCVELQMVYKDLQKLYAKGDSSQQQLSQPKKKIKKSPTDTPVTPNQLNKPIHVLTDIFISLMTKPPNFLRRAIHFLFQDVLQYLDETDVGNLLTVIATPDVQFIEEI